MCEHFQVYSKCYLSILSGHFDGLLPAIGRNQEKQGNTTKRKQKTGVHAYREHKGKNSLYKANMQIGINCENTMTEISHAEGVHHLSITENDYGREYYNTFQDHRNKRKYKEGYKDKYRDKNFYDSDRSYDTDNSHSRDRSYSRDRL